MPEGDTIHNAARRIRAVLLDRVPEQILTPHPRHRLDRWPERLAGRAVRAVDAHGKHLFVRFDGDLTLHSHLRMTGSWGVHREGARWKRARRRAWLVMRAGEWEVVQFDGPVLELMRESRTRFDRRLAALGQDVIGASFDEQGFLRRLRAEDPARAIGDALLDQRIVAGHRQRVEVRVVLRGRGQPLATARRDAPTRRPSRSCASRASACASRPTATASARARAPCTAARECRASAAARRSAGTARATTTA